MVAGGPRRPPQGKPIEKNPDTFRRIFSAHKKVRHGVALTHTSQTGDYEASLGREACLLVLAAHSAVRPPASSAHCVCDDAEVKTC